MNGAAKQRSARASVLPFVLALPLYLGLVWRFDYLCDDAFIYFRYATNLAHGLGLRFNADEVVPVDGYSSFLWVCLNAAMVLLGLELTVWTRVFTLALGVVFFVYLIAFVRRRLALGERETTAVALFLAATPAFAAWSTGGLETLTYALFVFAAFERLLGDPSRPHGVQAGLCAALAGLLRPEGPFLALWVIALGFATWGRTRRPELARACAVALAFLLTAAAAHAIWHFAYHGDVLANTARTKGGTSPARLLRGLRYSASYFVVFPGIAFALVAPLLGGAREHRALCLQSWGILAAMLGFAILVGGDFMPMGRFFVVGVPFGVILLAVWLSAPLAAPRRAATKLAVTAIAVVTTLLPAFDVHALPERLRELVSWRVAYGSEYQSWFLTRDGWPVGEVLGRALREHTQPGESLVQETIGVVGYYSGLRIYDQFCLVSRASDVEFVWDLPGVEAGHDRLIPAASFLPFRPTYLSADLIPKGSRQRRQATRASSWIDSVEPLYFPVDELVPGLGEVELELLRFTAWEWVGTPFLTLVDVTRDLDLFDVEGAQAELASRGIERADELARAVAAIRESIAGGQLFPGRKPLSWRVINRRGNDLIGYQVFAWSCPSEGPAHPAPNGAVVFSFALEGEPTVNGGAPGWTVVPPGGIHKPRVEGGVAFLACMRPPTLPDRGRRP